MTEETVAGIAAGQLKSFVERLERVNAERDELADDLRDIYAEAKANGFDVKVLRHVIKVRAQDADKRSEFETLADLYLAALGMLPGSPVAAPSEPPTRARAPARAREDHSPDAGKMVAEPAITPIHTPAPPAAEQESRETAASEAPAVVAPEAAQRAPAPSTSITDDDLEMPPWLDRRNPACPAYRGEGAAKAYLAAAEKFRGEFFRHSEAAE